MSIKTNENNIVKTTEQDDIEIINRNLMKIIINNWLNLQKIIKEEITLENMISTHQKEEFIQLKEYFKNFYSLKLKNRTIFEQIIYPEKTKNFLIQNDLKEIINIYNSIEDLLFLFRNNYDYIITLVSLISDDDEDEKVLSLAELFGKQFYENILIPNPEKEELLLLIFKLLEKEISQMCCTLVDEFLEDHTFLGKFFTAFNQRQELRGFLLSIINPMINEIENHIQGSCLNLSLYAIKDIYQNSPSENLEIENDFNLKDYLLSNIPKISINFSEIKFKNKDEDDSFDELDDYKNKDSEMVKSQDFEELKNIDLKYGNNDDNNIENKEELDLEYMNDLNLNYLQEKMNNEEDHTLKELYLYQIEQINDDENIFSNHNLLKALKSNKFKSHIKFISKKYKSNFIYIKSKIDHLIQSLYNKMDSIPYYVRCICKIIFILIKNKFPSLNKYLKNSFIGKYFFNKCLFPILTRESEIILNSQILSADTENCINIIKNVIDHANKCILFKSKIDIEYTIFNHYILELIPFLNIFYDKLIDIELPPIINNIIINKYLNSESRKISFDILSEDKNLDSTYDFFKRNNEELFYLQCICFSLDDLIFISSLIERDIQAFSSFEDFDKFEICYKSVKQNEDIIKDIINKNKDLTQFFVSFKEIKNSKLENLNDINTNNISKNKINNLSDNSPQKKGEDIICQKFKFSLKTILKGLNLINYKDYPYLNSSFNNKNFFDCLKYTLDDFGELNSDKNKISLKWYGEYIFNNKNFLEKKYIDNDYDLLYNELYKEELNNLNRLRSMSSFMISKDGMNLRCAENIVYKAKFENFIINRNKDLVGVDKFIEEEEIEVCFQINENLLKNNDNNKKDLHNENKKLKRKHINHVIISIIEPENCLHNQISKTKKEKDKEKNKFLINPYHAYSIKDFISKFSDNPWDINEKEKEKIKIPKYYVEEDINKGQRNNEIYMTFFQYKSILKNHIKSPTNPKANFIFTESDNALSLISDKIEDYIIRQIYNFVYPKNQSKSDLEFYNMTKKLSWVTPEHLEIKKLYINQLNNAILWIKKIDEKKSIRDKLFCVSSAYNTMNNTIKFSSGKNDDAGQDELTPMFQYIIIKAQPPRIFSNIDYIKCFLNNSQLSGELGFLVSQMEIATIFIMNINYQSLKISEEEFNQRMNGY